MATKLGQASGPHSAGIFADMTVDGPEIGTLVMIVDRAKNLPNRKTMGKQNPYCAARLGKEAKKTETDKRGGQTPRWDQELRFAVHDSPDYYTLKVSVFSEDKRTELVGEAWINLADVIVAGGGKSDVWQGLNCKGKYAGEVRIELTYYDSRPKPEQRRESSAAEDELRGVPRVKRRPLPSGNGSRGMTPESITEAHPPAPLPGRARHGPREIGTPSRVNSMPPETPNAPYGTSPSASFQTPPNAYNEYQQEEPQAYDEPEQSYAQPDFLPQLPPSNRQRGSSQAQRQAAPSPAHQRAMSHVLPHSHSAPAIPTMDSDYHPGFELHTEAPEPLPDLDYQHQHIRQRMNDAPPGWENPYEDPYAGRQPYVEEEEEEECGPPPPPMHSHSAPVVTQYTPNQSPASRYGATPTSSRQQYAPSASPLQSIEREYGSAQHTPQRGHPARGQSMDDYSPSSAQQRAYDNTPPSLVPGHTPSPTARSPATRSNMAHRHSVADPYYATPPRPHPLSQEVPRARSPMPDAYHEQNDGAMYEQTYRTRDAVPLIKPRAISPQPARPAQPERRPKSSYSLQFPVRAFESSDQSPLSTSQAPQRLPQTSDRSTPTRKSISSMRPSPTPPTPTSAGGVPFSPDSFDVHNPGAGTRASPLANAHSHSSPYHVRQEEAVPARNEQRGPIVGWDGREIDPSDHLPIDSWAPEPIKKTPTKTYGTGRDRDFGPRTTPNASSPATPGQRLSKDTVVNFRMKNQTQTPPQPSLPELDPPSSGGRIRLQKKSSPERSPITQQPLREHANYNSVPNPYAQQQEFSRGFRDGTPGISHGQYSRYDQQSQYDPQEQYDQQDYYGDAPALPPKVPMGGYELQQEDVLSREIANIDLGMHTGSTRRMNNNNATAYTPVRSQRDRHTYY